MSNCRFMYDNFLDGPGGLSLSSARGGAVGTPAPEALGSATCYALGPHTGEKDQTLVVEIDSVAKGSAVGQATFRWKRGAREGWEASGLATSSRPIALAGRVRIKWAPGQGQEFFRGDRWSILAVAREGAGALTDRDRDTAWRALGCATEWAMVDLGRPRRVKALVLADHNLSARARAVLKGNHADAWENPAYSQALEVTRPHLVFFLDQTHRFWRLELADPHNPDGFLEASLLYLGGCFQPARAFGGGYQQALVAGRRLMASDAGKVAGGATRLAVSYALGFSRLSPADAAALEEMLAVARGQAGGGLRPVFFTPFGDEPGNTVYCLPAPELERRQNPGGRWDLSLSLEEVTRGHA